MHTRTFLALLGGIVLAMGATAQDARFFRIVGPVPTTITDVTPEGWVTWINAPTNATFTVQTTTALSSNALNWTDWIQVPGRRSGIVLERNRVGARTFLSAGHGGRKSV